MSGAIVTDVAAPANMDEPYLRITPVAYREVVEHQRFGTVALDSYTSAGSHARVTQNSLRMEFALDVAAASLAEAGQALSTVIADLLRRPVHRVAGDRVSLRPFEPTSEVRQHFFNTGRTPFFVQMAVPVDDTTRRFMPWADPFLQTGPFAMPRDTAETTKI